MQISDKKYLIWSAIGRVRYREVSSRGEYELGPKNDVLYREVSIIICSLHRNFVLRVWPILSVPEKRVHCREVFPLKLSAISGFHCISILYEIPDACSLSWLITVGVFMVVIYKIAHSGCWNNEKITRTWRKELVLNYDYITVLFKLH